MSDETQGKAADFVKKLLTVGIGAVFLTEESVRNLISEFKLPKELLHGVLESAGRTKTEFFHKLSNEVMDKVISKVDPPALLQELLTKNEIEFTVRVNVKPKKTDA